MWIHTSDWRRLAEIIGKRKFFALASKLLRRGSARVQNTWNGKLSPPPIHFWDIPEVRRHGNRCVSGSEDVDARHYFAGKYLAGRSGLLALSLGCGSGGNELEWARLGCFSRIDACDLSPERIEKARRAAEQQGLAAVLHFFQADALHLDAAAEHYDLVLAEGSLHHLAPMETIMEKIRCWLKPEGFFLVDDFFGPSRFQWPHRQVELAEALLSLLPQRLRRVWHGGTKRHVDAPGRLRMWLVDPSEAAQSALIRPLLSRYFEKVEEKEKGGTLLNLLFYGIAHLFCGDDPEARRFLKIFIEVERQLLASGEISSDFVFSAWRKPAAVSTTETTGRE